MSASLNSKNELFIIEGDEFVFKETFNSGQGFIPSGGNFVETTLLPRERELCHQIGDWLALTASHQIL